MKINTLGIIGLSLSIALLIFFTIKLFGFKKTVYDTVDFANEYQFSNALSGSILMYNDWLFLNDSIIQNKKTDVILSRRGNLITVTDYKNEICYTLKDPNGIKAVSDNFKKLKDYHELHKLTIITNKLK